MEQVILYDESEREGIKRQGSFYNRIFVLDIANIAGMAISKISKYIKEGSIYAKIG